MYNQSWGIFCMYFRSYQRVTQLTPRMTHPKGTHGRHQGPAKANLPQWGQPLHNSSFTVVIARPHSQSVCRSFPPTYVSKAIKAQVQQETTYNQDKGYP